VWMEKFE